MNCLSCQKEIPAKLGYVSNAQRYCQYCFIHIIEKRVRKYIREHAKLKKGQRVVAKDSISRYFSEQVIHVPITLLKKATKKTDIIIQLITLDDIVARFIEHFLLGKKKQKKNKHELFLFSPITDEELTLYCQYKNLNFSARKHILKDFIFKWEQEHQGTLHSLAKSAKELEEII